MPCAGTPSPPRYLLPFLTFPTQGLCLLTTSPAEGLTRDGSLFLRIPVRVKSPPQTPCSLLGCLTGGLVQAGEKQQVLRSQKSRH